MATSTASARLLTLGRLALLDEHGQDLLPSESIKLLGLLAFLAAAPGRRATREQLIDLFWDDRSLEHSRGSLRQALHRLRDTLGDRYLPPGSGEVVLTDALRCDRDEFLAAIAAGDHEAAIALWGGPFVPGFVSRGSAEFERWRDLERERLQTLCSTTMEVVAQRALEAGDPRRAAALATRLLAMRPLDERAWRLRLLAEQQSGSRVQLAASIAELRHLLAVEGWQPEPRTVQLLQALERPFDGAADPADESPLLADLVGRGPLMAALYEAWRDAARRKGGHVHLSGGAGIGKSRALEDFGIRLQAERIRVVQSRALPRHRFVPGVMLASLVGALAELPGAPGISEHSARVLLAVQPSLATRFPAATPVDPGRPDARFLARLEALDDLVGAVCHDAPLCLILDDAHWWDDHSREIVEHLLERLDTRPMLVITAARPGPGTIHTAGTREHHQLEPLNRADILALISSLGEHPDADALSRFADGLHAASQGVPLFVLEALRLGMDHDLIRLAGRIWCFEHLDAFLQLLHPGRLLSERLATTTEAQRRLLLLAWLLEAPITMVDATAICSEAGAGILLDLERSGFIAAAHDGWVITHDAIGEALEAAARPDELREAHRAAGWIARARGESPSRLREAAAHFREAGADAELLETVTAWLQQQRAQQNAAPAAELLPTFLGPTVGPAERAELLHRLPRHLRRAPWTARRLAPLWAVGGAILVAGGWWFSNREPPPEAELGVLVTQPGGQVREFDIPLLEKRWAPGVHSASSERSHDAPEWRTTVDSLAAALARDPLHDRWIGARMTSHAGGPTDLLLHDAGGDRIVASAPGDDVDPAWSPDGQRVVFGTMRWSPANDPAFDLGVVDVASGDVRQLTRGADTDHEPFWSPDGTRIAFIRVSAKGAQDALCWTPVIAASTQCQYLPDAPNLDLRGWLNSSQVLLGVGRGDLNHLILRDIDTGTDQELPLNPDAPISLSPDGAWMAQVLPSPYAADTGSEVAISRSATPELSRRTHFAVTAARLQLVWRRVRPPRFVSRLLIRRTRDTLPVGTPFHLEAEALDVSGRPTPFPAAVMRWESSDSGVARVDSAGTVTGLRPGRVTIIASAGGWRTASDSFLVRTEPSHLLFEEDWTGDWSTRWNVWGAPSPRVVLSPNGHPAFLPNGDREYTSGAYTAAVFGSADGLAVDLEISTPITQPKWQFLEVGLQQPSRLTPSGPDGEGCHIRYPPREGGAGRLTFAGAPVDSSIWSGAWYTLRVQLFPDGTCGYAINGRVQGHPPEVRVAHAGMLVVLGGQTVASDLLIRRVRVWSGVPSGASWSTPGSPIHP